MDRISPIYRLGGIRLEPDDMPDSKRLRLHLGDSQRAERESRVGSTKSGGRRSIGMIRSRSFGEKENDYVKRLHSSYDEVPDSIGDETSGRRGSLSIANGESQNCDSETASAANTPSSDLCSGPLPDNFNQKRPIYSRSSGSQRRQHCHPQQRFFPTSSYDVEVDDDDDAQPAASNPPQLPRWGSDISLSRLTVGPPDSPKASDTAMRTDIDSPNRTTQPAPSPSLHAGSASPAGRSASRRSSQGDVSPCLHAFTVENKAGLPEIHLTASYLHHRAASPVRVHSPAGAHRRDGSPARGPARRGPWGAREGSPSRASRSFLHREGSPTRDAGCRKKGSVSPRRRRTNVSPRARRPSAWQSERWGSMSALDDDLGARIKDKLALIKTYSLPDNPQPRRRQAIPVTRQPWPPRDEARFAAGKAQMLGMEMNPFEFSSDDLCHLALEIFVEMELPERLGLPLERLQRFILAVRDRMYENPYHNWMHVFDVTRTVYSLAHLSGVLERLTDWEKMGLITATLCHDLEHPGVNNMFLSKSNSALAKMYKDAQVLEKHHSLRAFELMVDEEVDLLRGLNTSKYYEFRTMVTKAIMATDMAKHPEYIQKLDKVLDGSLEPDKQFEVELLIKSADTSNVLKPFDVAKRWAIRITDEFFLQGDLERQGGMEVTRMCDRHSQSRVGMQKGFIDFVIGPFFSKMEAAYPGLRPCVDHMRSNRAEWDLYTDERLLAEVDDQARCFFLPSPPVSQSTTPATPPAQGSIPSIQNA